MIRAAFDFGGMIMALETEDQPLLDTMRILLAPLETEAGPPADIVWDLRHGVPPPPRTGEVMYRGPMPYSGADCVMAQERGTIEFNVADRLRLRVFADGRGDLVVRQSEEHLLLSDFGMILIEASLAKAGQTMLHGAALATPDGESAVFLFAASGAGKTSTALSLAREGFALMSDDIGVLRPDGEALHLWGLPRHLNVHRRTAELLPWMPALPEDSWDGDDEQSLAPEAIAGIAVARPRLALPLAAIVWLGERREGATIVQPLPRAEALAALASDNVRRSERGMPEVQMARFHALADAVRRTPTYLMRAGSNDLSGIATALAGSLDP